MSSATSTPSVRTVRRLPRPGRPSGIRSKQALGVVAAVAPPGPLPVALGRPDLAVYTMAGSLRALYAHRRPCAARAGMPAGVVLGMLGGLASALVGLRVTADAAAGEWWQRTLPRERVVLAEQSGHRTLAATVRRRGPLPDPGTDTEGVRP